MDIINYFLYQNNFKEHLITIVFCIFLICASFLILWLTYKTKKLSLCSVWKIIDLFIWLIISIILFRTIRLQYAISLLLICYLFAGASERNKRKIRYINYIVEKDTGCRKVYKYIHSVKHNNFTIDLKELLFLPKDNIINNIVFDKRNPAWKKSFLPFGYFVIGLIYPSLNLLINGSQFSCFDNIILRLLEINILIFSILWYIYPIAYFFAVKIETGIMFKSKIWFNISFVLFSLALIFALNGILVLL